MSIFTIKLLNITLIDCGYKVKIETNEKYIKNNDSNLIHMNL